MVRKRDIANYVRRLAREFSPEKVVLFGSYAYGKPTAGSDVDLLVVMNHRKRKNVHQAVEIDVRLPRSFPLDLIVRQPSEIRRRIAMNDFFLKRIVEKGEVLYARRPLPRRIGREGGGTEVVGDCAADPQRFARVARPSRAANPSAPLSVTEASDCAGLTGKSAGLFRLCRPPAGSGGVNIAARRSWEDGWKKRSR